MQHLLLLQRRLLFCLLCRILKGMLCSGRARRKPGWTAEYSTRVQGRAGGSLSASHSLLPSGDQFVLLQSGKKGPLLFLSGQSCEFHSLHLVPGGTAAPT